MQSFRRSPRQLFVEIIYTVLASVSALVLAAALLPRWPFWAIAALSLLCGLSVGWLEIAEQTIRLEWEQGTLRYYKRGRLIRTIPLHEYTVTQRRTVIRNSVQNLWLEFRKPGSEHSDFAIDCMPLGETSFIALYYLITSR